MRVLAESDWANSSYREMALAVLQNSKDALARRCAADALGQHPDLANVRPLLDALASADKEDTHFVHVLRMALRNQLRPAESFAKLKDVTLSDAEVLMLAVLSVSIDTGDAATFLLDHVRQLAADKAALTKYLQHAVRFATAPKIEPLAKLMRDGFAGDPDLQLEMFQSVRQGFEQRGQPLPDEAKRWGEALATGVLKSAAGEVAWANTPTDREAQVTDPWDYEVRRCGDEQRVPLLSSLPGGENATAVLKSKPFSCPRKLVFFLAGHNGEPSTPEQVKNVVRLKLVSTGEPIAEKAPPRDDVARKVTWDLSSHAGEQVYLEATDGDAGNAYAWLAFGRFGPEVVPMPAVPVHALQRRLRNAAEMAASLKLEGTAPEIERAMLDRRHETDTRAALAAALAALRADASVPAMKQIIGDADELMTVRERVAAALGATATPAAQQAIVDSFKLAPRELQTALANALASNTASAETLLEAVGDGKAPARLLLELGIHDRLAAAGVPNLEKRVKQLTKGVAAPKEELEKLIAERRAAFKSAHPSPGAGQAVFARNCMACHQVDGKGGAIGPNLAGLNKRGIDRLVEDVLDPNRNVDPAFRYSTLILKDGRLITGLQKKEEGEVLTFADTTGKMVDVKKGEIQQRIESPASLMPSNFAEILRPDDFNNLIAYLLSK
jgi:putative heme-binding domain-containing protein